jgi:hypothetical protein
MLFELIIVFFRHSHTVFSGHLLDNSDNFGKYFWPIFFHEGHELFDFFLFLFGDDHFIALIHKSVELFN